MKRLATVCLLAASTQVAFASAAEINNLNWPEKTECEPCISVQIDELALNFSPTALSRVTTFGELPGLHLFGTALRGDDKPLSIIRLETGPLIGAVQRMGILSDHASPTFAEVFDAIAHLAAEDERRPQLHRLFELGKPYRVIRSETIGLIAYIFWNTDSEISKVIVALPDCDSIACDAVYEIHGPISAKELSSLLGGLERRPPP